MPLARDVRSVDGAGGLTRRAGLCLLCIAAAAALLAGATFAPTAAGAQEVFPSFTYEPRSPNIGDTVTFTSTSVPSNGNEIVSLEWDFDGGGTDATGPQVVHAFPTPGSHAVRLTVTDKHRTQYVATETVPVGNRAPNVWFEFSPQAPRPGEPVTFVSNAWDPDGEIAELRWDFDGDDSYSDGSGPAVTHAFATPGSHVVKLLAIDRHDGRAYVARRVSVGNRAPSASFVHFPAAPQAGDVVSFFSTASDPDGPLAEQTWDLDGDGSFEDANGGQASRIFGASGSHTVSLRVADGDGAAAIAYRTVVVSPRARQSTGTLSVGGTVFRLLNPFPIVRAAGTISRRGTKLRLTVNAPRGARVKVFCRGRRCPVRRQARTAGGREVTPWATMARSVRFHRLGRRVLPPGVKVRVYVTKARTIGKYTSFTIRRNRPPARVDRCIVPTVKRPVRCPD